MKVYFKLFILVLLFTPACKDKNTTKNTYTLTGTLLKNCDGEPAANTELALQLESNEFLSVEWGGSTTRFKTDANGYFSVKYQTVSNSGISIVLFNNVGYTRILSAIPQNQNLDLGNVYISKKYKFILTANLVNQYTENDTLFFRYGNSTKLFSISGPFTNILDTLEASSFSTIYKRKKNELIRIVWDVNSKNMKYSKDFEVLGYCNDLNSVEIDL